VSPPAGAFGCVLALVAVAVGALAALAQNGTLVNTWTYCQGIAPQIALDQYPEGDAYVGLYPTAVRLLLYSVWFGVVGGFVRRRFRGGILLVVPCALAACAVLFAMDYSVFSGMPGGAYLPGRCPGGHLSWWPW
jgi:hypothetical protein